MSFTGGAGRSASFGIRIEDVILVTAEGPKNLSARLPRK